MASPARRTAAARGSGDRRRDPMRQPLEDSQRDRIAAGLPFVESLARRVAASRPHSIGLGDLVQEGRLGLIDAACRFDEGRGIKFETFAERRVRGAMIDALRRDAWPRGVRRQRRQLEAAREQLRRELGAEPSLADLAARMGSDEARLGRTIVRITTIESTSPLSAGANVRRPPLPSPPAPPPRMGSDEARLGRTIVRITTIESTSPLSAGENVDGATLPPALVPSEPIAPDRGVEGRGVRDAFRAASA